MEQAESSWELCEASTGGRDGWRSLFDLNLEQWAPWSGHSGVHCTSLHRAGRRAYPTAASAFAGTSGEWEVIRFGLRDGAPTDVDLLPKVWAVNGAESSDTEEAEEGHESDSAGWHSLASIRRENDVFSVYVVLPAQGIYVLRVYVALPDAADDDQTAINVPEGDATEQPRHYAHAVDFLIDASAPSEHWVDCTGCLYPRMFGAAGAVTLHAPRQRILRTGHEFNLVLELPSNAREQTLVVRDAGTGREVQLHRTTIGTLLEVPKLVRVAHAGSFRCSKEGPVTVFTRRRGERRMRAVMEFQCHSAGHAPVPGTGGVMPPSNVAAGATASIRCERLACLPILPNMAFISDDGLRLGLTLESHTAAAWTVAAAETARVVVSTAVPTAVSAQLREAGVPEAAQDKGLWTLVSSSDGGHRHTVELRCRRPWRYELLLFAGPRAAAADTAAAPRSLPMVVQYTVDATPAAVDPDTGAKKLAEQYPSVFSEFGSCSTELLQPRERKLTAGLVSVNFTLVLGAECEATGVAVIQAGAGDDGAPLPQWTHLEKESSHLADAPPQASNNADRGTDAAGAAEAAAAAAAAAAVPVVWSGVVEGIVAGKVQIAIRLAPSETQYRHLVEYDAE